MGGNPEGYWVLDSGCTSHMINNSDSLTNVTGMESEMITSKKNENMFAELKGDIVKNVYSKMCCMFQKITENGGIVKFTDNGVEILKVRSKITGKKDNTGLYDINLNCSETTLLSESKQTSDLNLWHRRIGHLSVGSMKKLATLSFGLEKRKFYRSEIQCETCLTLKQTEKTFWENKRERERERE
ncbi:hypothetical protein PR048_029849 [Dryococelus australis]|uniref:GAG-pre-integrase domain-containing protein n=1 Tax=Dryococelus australis TaxID=614101 RepID=A0ABQ9GA74_9NEOP|nr:hypothetical protein PR048_029849 [Dryococelus australis]